MASLTGTKIKDTYDGLLKTTDNGGLGASAKLITDGLGNSSGVYLGTSGNVGIGVSPANPLHIQSSSAVLINAQCTGASSFIQLTNSGGAAGVKSTSNDLILWTSTSGTERMRIDSSGRVGIGRDAEQILHLKSANPIIKVEDSTTSGVAGGIIGKIDFWGNDFSGTGRDSRGFISSVYEDGFARAALIFATGPYNQTATERMRITSGGSVLVGTQSQLASEMLAVRGESTGNVRGISVFTPNASQDALIFYTNGGASFAGKIATSGTTTTYATSSDYRLKEDWQPMSDSLTRIDALKPVNFAWKADGSRVDGFLAHELQEVIPEAVTGEKDATEEYEVTPAEYKTVVVTPAQEAVYETIEHPAIAEELDADGNIIVEAQEAWTEEVLVSEAVEEVTEQVLVSEAVMGTRPVYQGIDQSKIVPLLTAGLQEAHEMIKQLEARIAALEAK